MRDTTHATVTKWTEYRTPSGRWSKVRHDETSEDFKPHNLPMQSFPANGAVTLTPCTDTCP